MMVSTPGCARGYENAAAARLNKDAPPARYRLKRTLNANLFWTTLVYGRAYFHIDKNARS
jgi:hypothetical protein